MKVPDQALHAALVALQRGELVAFPTETVYGLGADARNESAARRIFAAKGRPASHPLIVHLADEDSLALWARDIPPVARALAAAFWPGPLTLVLPRAADVLGVVTGGQDTVAVRVPAHPVAQALLQAFGGGIAAPSANRYGRISPTRAEHVREELGAAVSVILDGGDCAVGLESTIVACLEGAVSLLRPGHITQSQIARVAGVVLTPAADAGPRVPGSDRSHYAPSTPLQLLEPGEFAREIARDQIAVLATRPAPAEFHGRLWLTAGVDPAAYAHDLYANLRRLDQVGAARILVEAPPLTEAWAAVRDRLQRASRHEIIDSP